MRLSEQWLRAWVNPNIGTAELAEQLTMAGLEVDAVTAVAPDFTGVVVGEIQAVEQHPNADRLRVCKVNIGSEVLQIVCGGANVAANMKVPVATIGACLPGDFKIKKSKLRDVESQGMICSTPELGLGDCPPKHIMVLANDAPIGADIREYLQLNDHSFEIELTPNRSDCLSIAGIAREVAVINKMTVKELPRNAVKPTQQMKIEIKLQDSLGCPHYVGRVISKVNNDVASPVWLQERLRRSGIRSVNAIVDVTNYVMLELGQPMHAFDLDKLSGDIVVRKAKSKEKITLLDEQAVILDEKTLVIADQQGAQAIAGVMGGLHSAVSETTQNIFLESAFFDPAAVRQAAKQYAISTDSSYRFERGVDYQLQAIAMEYATKLLIDIVGGEPGPITEAQDKATLPQRHPIILLEKDIARILGVTIAVDDVVNMLQRLGMVVESHTSGWQVTPPSYRFDIQQPIDLIEELARVYGYNTIPSQTMVAGLKPLTVSETNIPEIRIKQLLVDLGYFEAITYSFVDAKLQHMLDPDQQAVRLANPISEDLAVMRTSLWPGLLQLASHNQNRQVKRQRLFETGLCFTNQGEQQQPRLAILTIGSVMPEQWGEVSRVTDAFDLKSDIMKIIGLGKCQSQFVWKIDSHPALHPGQTAGLYYQNKRIGYLGSLHPELVTKLSLHSAPILFEADLAALQTAQLPDYKDFSKFPMVRRDLAFVVDRDLPVGKLSEMIKKISGHTLIKLEIFDIYQGGNIDVDKKSVAMGLTFQDASRTLVDSEINHVIQNIINQLESEVNAKLRV